ncbi:MAG TPA: hypothetical protein VD905_01500 [Flavobacteriales bacterium]|nr:hypothetical protein [Flavobacteriales bacterium]
MKHAKIFWILWLIALPMLVNSQGFYTGVGGGYGLGAARNTSQDYVSVDDGTNVNNTYTAKHYSYGQGTSAGLYAGYMIKNGFGVELGYSYVKGSTFEFISENRNSFFNFNTKYLNRSYGKTMRLMPAVRLSFGEKKLTGYAKAGIVLGIGNKLTDENEDSFSAFGVTQTDYRITEYTGGMAFGVHGSLGVTYMFTNTLGIFAEVGGFYQEWAPKRSELIKYTIDGQNELGSLTTYQKETEYVDEYTDDGSTNTNEPDKQTKVYFPFSSININIGIHFSFGKTE